MPTAATNIWVNLRHLRIQKTHPHLLRRSRFKKLEPARNPFLWIEECELRSGSVAAGKWGIKCLVSANRNPNLHSMRIGDSDHIDGLQLGHPGFRFHPRRTEIP